MCGGVSCLGVSWIGIFFHNVSARALPRRTFTAQRRRFNPLPTPLGRRRLQ